MTSVLGSELDDLATAIENARSSLLHQRNEQGHWEGRLSSSALSTATAICAIRDYSNALGSSADHARQLNTLRDRGLHWLAQHQNSDGGWGDTTLSHSNISTTALCWAAFSQSGDPFRATVKKCEDWLTDQVGSLAPQHLATAIRNRYGKDHTFSVPILTALALSGRLGNSPDAWALIPQLPFELAACPHTWFAALRLPVVSYALPALISIGLVRHHVRPSRNLLLRFIRNAVRERTLRLLRDIQPDSGGYLEASPLTSFVVMSLVGADRADHPVVQKGLGFLRQSVRDDGSWAIDSNLATWVTTSSLRALTAAPSNSHVTALANDDSVAVRRWLLGQQYCVEHPYTHAAPGGWAWTDLPGGVPDADDTSGALLALHELDDGSEEVRTAAATGIGWLVGLQNRDGGIPTFCRGWGALPFDQSSADLTAHALRAWRAWSREIPPPLNLRVDRARKQALSFLKRQQREDGSWNPLWFGNQHSSEEENLTYGTSRVLLALVKEMAPDTRGLTDAVARGTEWLLTAQHKDGGWGGSYESPSSIEETALALETVATLAISSQSANSDSFLSQMSPRLEASMRLGTAHLIKQTCNGRQFPPAPIGFYFAKLWYYESLYPVTFTVAALGAVQRYWCLGRRPLEVRQ